MCYVRCGNVVNTATALRELECFNASYATLQWQERVGREL